MDQVILLAEWFFFGAAALHFSSIIAVLVRFGRNEQGDMPRLDDGGVSILLPVCGLENYVKETLRSSLHLDHPRYEVLFCVAQENDPVVPIVRDLIAAHPHIDARLLIGHSDVTANPKLNNMFKGWEAARYDWILMVDSNVLMPVDHIQQMRAVWTSDTALVCSPPAGIAPQNFWAELECAFLNTHQARWQCFVDSIGFGFTQGKSMLWNRELLTRIGGIQGLGREVAEDAAATKAVRELGLKARLVTDPFPQPLGFRGASDVWRRQVRWARLRRDTFKLWFIPELLTGGLTPLAAATVAALAGAIPEIFVALTAVAWYGAEALLARAAGWPMTARSIAALLVRDVLLPVLWFAAWAGNDFTWRGNAMTLAENGRSS